MRVWQSLLNFLFPKKCVGCGRYNSYLCTECEQHVRIFPLPIGGTTTYALSHHEGAVRTLIAHMKYYGHFDVATCAARLLAKHLPPVFLHCDAICAVPLYKQRERERGYNQSALLAQALSSELHTPYLPLLHKVRSTRQQAKLTRQERIMNVKHAFHSDPIPVGTENVLLIDDVTTTGATLTECVQALKAAGAKRVYCATLAHGK